MGRGCSPAELATVTAMICASPLEWLVLALPDGRFGALWAQGLEGDHGAAIAQGDYSACAFVGASLQAAICYAEAHPDD
jgi:hypothetical protein